MKYSIPQSELDKVRKLILKDVGESVLVEIKRKIKKRAYNTGKLMRSTELTMTPGGFEIGSHEKYAEYLDSKQRLFEPDEYVDAGVDNALR